METPTEPLSIQQVLNRQLGTTDLSKQQCFQRLAGSYAEGMTAQDAARNWAGTEEICTIQEALRIKMSTFTGDDYSSIHQNTTDPYGTA